MSRLRIKNNQQVNDLLPSQQTEAWLSPSLLPQDLALHTLIPLQLPFPPCPSKTPNLCPYATPISLGDRMGSLPKQGATGSALLAAEAVTPRAVPTPEAKRVGLCLGSHGSGTRGSFVPQHSTSKSSMLPGRVCNWLFHPALPLHQDCCQTL